MASNTKSKAANSRAVKAVIPPAKGVKRRMPLPLKKAHPVILRALNGEALEVPFTDHDLYPLAVSWNRMLGAWRERSISQIPEWRENARKVLAEISGAGPALDKFLNAAAASGLVQVEFRWESEAVGWAARVFPWEVTLALATKTKREALGGSRWFLVVRVLDRPGKGSPATGDPAYGILAPCNSTVDFTSEKTAIKAALGGALKELEGRTTAELRASIRKEKPRILHLGMSSGEEVSAGEGGNDTEEVAAAFASHRPALAVFSGCYTGRRLAPLAVAAGAEVALGFHSEVLDSSIPLFFGAFYRSWQSGSTPVQALLHGLTTHNLQALPGDLGAVVLWMDHSAIGQLTTSTASLLAAIPPVPSPASSGEMRISSGDIEAALPVTCDIEPALNYSVLQNSRGGLFKEFSVTKVRPGIVPDVEVLVRLDSGVERPTESRFFVRFSTGADRHEDLAKRTFFPLGAPLLRRRGETMLGTVEIILTCEQKQIFHRLEQIKILPCDEWRDDSTGRHLLPAFIFPRDPAVRDLLSTAEPFLRVLCDQPGAGFDGYQAAFANKNPGDAVKFQSRAIWGALQALRFSYISPTPVYTKSSQRLRTPEEMLRARRGTCIELALLLASCWEHAGLQPILFLSRNHAFAGCWTRDRARSDFSTALEGMLKHAQAGVTNAKDARKDPLGGRSSSSGNSAAPSWVYCESFHPAVILDEIKAGRLLAVEATCVTQGRSFSEATEQGQSNIEECIAHPGMFDAMIDVESARAAGVTPLAIVGEGSAA